MEYNTPPSPKPQRAPSTNTFRKKIPKPVPQPGKFAPRIQTAFVSSAEVTQVQVTLTAMPALAGVLHAIGFSALEAKVEEGEPIDLQPTDIAFAGELTASVSASLSVPVPLAQRIRLIDAPVPLPLLQIADTLGTVHDDLGVQHELLNAHGLMINHFIAAGHAAMPNATLQSTVEAENEARQYTEYPEENPKFFMPNVFVEEAFFKENSKPILAAQEALRDAGVNSPAPSKKKNDTKSFARWILESSTWDYSKIKPDDMELIGLQLAKKLQCSRPTLKQLARTVNKSQFLSSLGVIEIDPLFKTVEQFIKRTDRTITQFLGAVMPVGSTQSLTPEGSPASIIHVTNGQLTSSAKCSDLDLTLAFLIGMKVKPPPTVCTYKCSEEWKPFAEKWIRSFLLEMQPES